MQMLQSGYSFDTTAYLLNWDKYEQEKPWTFSGMYFFHCRKVDKNAQQKQYEKHSKQLVEDKEQLSAKESSGNTGVDFVDDGDVTEDELGEDIAEDDDFDEGEHKQDVHSSGFAGQAKEYDSVEADYEEVQEKDTNFKTNTKYK